jgi:Cysteine rich repeat
MLLVTIEAKDVFMPRIAKSVYLIVALTLTAVSAVAQDRGHKGTKEEQDACEPDVYKFCEAAIPDENKILACLKVNVKQLSPKCRKVLKD